MDRDGTLIAERSYLSDPEGVELLPKAAEGLRRFEESGWGCLVVTNQSGIARGYFSRDTVDAIHARMRTLLEQRGARIDGIYVCPHEPEDQCTCRKPGTGMVLKAAADWDFDPSECIFIGDKSCDIELGRAMGATTVLVRTGHGEEHYMRNLCIPDFVVRDLTEAAEVLMKDSMRVTVSRSLPNSGDSLVYRAHLTESIATKQRVMAECETQVLTAAAAITESLASGGKLLICGNGGSAADAQHIAAEMVSVLSQDFIRPGIAAVALTTDTSILTAIANDFGYGAVFERQINALGRRGDVVIGITTSGNSESVVRALRAARDKGMRTIALTGRRSGTVLEVADIAIRVPSDSVQHIQESHVAIGHILCAIVERSPGVSN